MTTVIRGPGKAWCAPGREEPATHEPLISRAMRAEVPLVGLCFRPITGGGRQTRKRLVGANPTPSAFWEEPFSAVALSHLPNDP
jgi:hypothetical protein